MKRRLQCTSYTVVYYILIFANSTYVKLSQRISPSASSVQGANARAPNGSRAPDKRLDPTPRSHRKAVQRAPETLPLQGGGFRECRPWNHDRGKQVETLPYAPNSFGILGPLEERNGGISDVRKDPAGKLTTLPYPAGRRRPVASSKPGPSKSQKRTNW